MRLPVWMCWLLFFASLLGKSVVRRWGLSPQRCHGAAGERRAGDKGGKRAGTAAP